MKQDWKCLGDCGKQFAMGDWECFPGVKHVVTPKEYYLLDAPSPKEDSFRKSRTQVHNIPPEKTIKDAQSGELVRIPGGWVDFIRGMAIVTDAEKQYWLDKNGYDKVTKEQWERVYFSETEKQAMRESALRNREADIERKTREANDLLASVKASVKKSAEK